MTITYKYFTTNPDTMQMSLKSTVKMGIGQFVDKVNNFAPYGAFLTDDNGELQEITPFSLTEAIRKSEGSVEIEGMYIGQKLEVSLA